MERNEILRSYGTDYKNMTKRLLEAAGLAEEIPFPEASVCIKPNLVVPTPAEFGATTHPEIVAGILEYLFEHGFRNVFIAEGCWVGDKTKDCFEYCGYNTLSRTYGVPLVDVQTSGTVVLDCAGMELKAADFVKNIDYLINVPVLKGHCQVYITCALKNMKGLVPNGEKKHFHAMKLHEPIAHLNTAVRQDFIVIDNICGDLSYEGGGEPVVNNCILAAKDPVLTDSFVCRELGYETEQVPYIGLAESLGLGCSDLSTLRLIDVEGEAPEQTLREQARFSMCRKLTDVEDEDACSGCMGAAAEALRRLKEEGLLAALPEKVCAGMGYKGKRGKLGIGSCTAGFESSLAGCPPSAEQTYEFLKKYIGEQKQ